MKKRKKVWKSDSEVDKDATLPLLKKNNNQHWFCFFHFAFSLWWLKILLLSPAKLNTVTFEDVFSKDKALMQVSESVWSNSMSKNTLAGKNFADTWKLQKVLKNPNLIQLKKY